MSDMYFCERCGGVVESSCDCDREVHIDVGKMSLVDMAQELAADAFAAGHAAGMADGLVLGAGAAEQHLIDLICAEADIWPPGGPVDQACDAIFTLLDELGGAEDEP